ncbi:unnamed protein product [Clavelina lepadiformis]|uniref:Uncharacterized protein n=1 Tax=Clavelina lepadiformis TaxID=159417 RepID=A0ABP0GSF0_CLALP
MSEFSESGSINFCNCSHNGEAMRLKTCVTNVSLPTKSMQKIVTSIATRVTQLIISSPVKQATNSTKNPPLSFKSTERIVSSAESLLTSLKDFIEATKKTVSHQYPEDVGVEEEVDVASQQLLISGEKLLLCSQVLSAMGGSVEEEVEAKSDLAGTISTTFQSLVVLLMCVDNAEVRRLVSLGNVVLDHLAILTTATKMETLVDYFSNFSHAVHQFHRGANQRRSDLLSSRNSLKMNRLLTTLKHSMPMLSTALSMSIKYPQNEEAISSKLFAVQQVEKTLDDIVTVIKASPGDDGLLGDGHAGAFVSEVQAIDRMLGPEHRCNLDRLELETQVQSLVQHQMSLSAFLDNRFPMMSKKSKLLVKECQKLVDLTCDVTKTCPQHRPSKPIDKDDGSEYGSVCRVVRAKLKTLTKLTVTIVLALFSHMFTITNEPLSELLRIYSLVGEKNVANFLPKLKSTLEVFQTYCNDMQDTSKFISMLASDANSYTNLLTIASNANGLSTQIIEYFLFVMSNLDDNDSTSFKKENVKILTDSWLGLLQNLIHGCSSCLDVGQLVACIENEIVSEFEKCHEEIVNLDEVSLSKHLISVTGKSRLLASVANGVVASSSDPIYRNGVLAHISQLNEGISHTVASGNQLIEDSTKLSYQEGFLAAASEVKARAASLRLALTSMSCHPELVSEERKGLRDFSDKDALSGMIKEMHTLNKKLSRLGFEPNTPGIDFARPVTSSKRANDDVDEILGTSGPAVDLDSSLSQEVDADAEEEKLHPLVGRILEIISRPRHDEKLLHGVYQEVKKMSRAIAEIVADSDSCMKSCKMMMKDPLTEPAFVGSRDTSVDAKSVGEVIEVWMRAMNESCNLMEELLGNLDDTGSLETLRSLAQSWSKSSEIIIRCCSTVLHVHSLSLRRFLIGNHNDCLPAMEESPTHPLDSGKSHGGLEMLGRFTETIHVLLSDVIAFYKREMPDWHAEGGASGGLILRLDAILSRSAILASDITATRKVISGKATNRNHPLNDVEWSWLHVHALTCASKVCALSSNAGMVTQLVLGVKHLPLPTAYFLHGGDEELDSLKTYGSRIRTMTSSSMEKFSKSMKEISVSIEEESKLNKVKGRIDVTCGSIEKILEFLIAQKRSELLTRHGYVVCHLVFLHHRFMLEVSRINLVSNQLSQLVCQEEESPVELEELGRTQDHQHTGDLGPSPTNQGSAFNERLKVLTKQRKEREKELFYLLSDVDGDILSSTVN